MNLDTLNEVKDRGLKNDLTNEVEINKMNEEMNDLGEKLQTYLNNNKEPNRDNKMLDIPIDFEINTGRNELGDTTILGKITIEKSAMDDLEKIQDKSVSVVKSGLDKVYDIVKDTFIEKAAEKVLDIGAKVLKTAVKVVGTLSKKVLKI